MVPFCVRDWKTKRDGVGVFKFVRIANLKNDEAQALECE